MIEGRERRWWLWLCTRTEEGEGKGKKGRKRWYGKGMSLEHVDLDKWHDCAHRRLVWARELRDGFGLEHVDLVPKAKPAVPFVLPEIDHSEPKPTNKGISSTAGPTHPASSNARLYC